MSLIIWYRNRQLQKLNLQHHSDYKGWEGVERIALYFEATQIKEAEIEAWIQFFEAAGKNVEVLVYQSVKRKDLNPNWPYPSICKDDKSWWGWPSGLDFGTFKQHNFDLFFDFSKGEEPVHQIVAETAVAGMKVAFQKRKSDWADLVVRCEKEGYTQACREEVLALLKFINAQ